MKIAIKGRDPSLNNALREFVEDRVIAKLSGNVRSLMISTRDINGPRGGIDHIVLVVMHLASGSRIVVRNHTLDPFAGAISAIKTAVRLLRRERRRRRTNVREAYRQSLF